MAIDVPSSARYDDEQLIELLRQNSPEDLSAEQIDQLRRAIHTSPELREQLVDDLRLGEAMASHYAPKPSDITKVSDRIEALATSRRRERLWRLYGIGVCAVLVLSAFATAGYWMSENAGPNSLLSFLSRDEQSGPDPRKGVGETALRFKANAKGEQSDSTISDDTDTGRGQPSTNGDGKPTHAASANTATNQANNANGPPAPANGDAQANAFGGVDLERQPLERDRTDPPPMVKHANSNAADQPPPKIDLIDLDWTWYLDPLINRKAGRLLRIRELFKPIDDARFEANEPKYRPGTIEFDGWYELARPLRNNQNLRLAIRQPEHLSVDLWNAHKGVRFHLGDQYWVGYRLQRKDKDNRKPDSVRRAALGTGASGRFRHGTFDVSYQQGQLMLTEGGMVLTALPLDKPPKQIYLHGKGELALAQLRPAAHFDLPEPLTGSSSRTNAQHAGEAPNAKRRELSKVQWLAAGNENLSVAQPGPGKVRIGPRQPQDNAAEDGKSAGAKNPEAPKDKQDPDDADSKEKTENDQAEAFGRIARMPMPKTPGFDVVFKVNRAPDGTQFFVQAKGDKPEVLGTVKTIDGQRMLLDPDTSGSSAEDAKERHQAVGKQFFLRFFGQYRRAILMAGMQGRVWYTLDSENYGEDALDTRPDFLGVRLPDQKTKDKASDKTKGQSADLVELEQLHVDTHHALADLAPNKLRRLITQAVDGEDKMAKQLNQADSLEAFGKAVNPLKPEHVAEDPWQMAVDVATFERLPREDDAVQEAIDDLMVRAIGSNLETERILAAFRELTKRYNIGQGLIDPRWLRHRFGELAIRESEQGQTDQLARMLQTWYELEFTQARELFDDQKIVPEALSRHLFYRRMAANRWEPIREQALRLRFLAMGVSSRNDFDSEDQPMARLSRWMLGKTRLWLGARKLARFTMPRGWGHPLSTGGDRQTETAVAELRAAVKRGQYLQAANLLTARPLANRLVSVGDDPDLLRSSHYLVRTLIARHSALGQLLREQFAQLGTIRVRRALNAGDVETLRSLAVQFTGTQAGARAQRALADRDLSMGRFFSAASRYRSLIEAGPQVDRALRAKHRLAWAMIGQRRGNPIKRPVRLGQRRYKADEFEKMIDRAIASRGSLGGESASPAEAASRDSQANRETDQNGGTASDGQTDNQPRAFGPTPFTVEKLTTVSRNNLDQSQWERGKVTLTADNERLLVSSREKTTAYDPKNGDEQWVTKQGIKDKDQRWYVPAHPISAGKRIYQYWQHDNEGSIRAIAPDQTKLWQTTLDDGVLTDPVQVGSALYAISKKQVLGDSWRLNLHRIDPRTGRSVAKHRLARINPDDAQRSSRRMLTNGRKIIIHLPGIVICTDDVGQVQWVRRLAYIHESVDEDLWEPMFKPRGEPIQLVGDSLLVRSPGSPYVHCLDLDDGETRWRTTLPDSRGITMTAHGRVFIRTKLGITALDFSDGSPQWTHTDPPSSGRTRYVPGPNDAPLMVHHNTHDDRWSLGWLNAQTGDLSQTHKLDSKADQSLGPIVVGKNQLFALGNFRDGSKADLLTIKPGKPEKDAD